MADYRESSTDPAVKLSGVAALTTDQAMVVALSPNSNSVSVVSQPELVTTGTITTTDIVVPAPAGTGVLLSGTPTAGSYVAALATGGNASVVIGITGLTSGTLYYEGSADSTTGVDGNWIALNIRQAGITNTQISSFATASGLYRGNTAGIRYIRMRSVGTLTGTPAITLRLSAGVAGEFLFGSIPTGTNSIGSISANIATVSAVTVMQNAVAVTANGANLPVTGYGTAVLQISGAFVASINFEASIDAGVTWTAISATQVGFGDIFSVVTVPGTFRLTTTGIDLIRARVTWTSGTSITINGRSTNAINASKIVKLATGTNSIGTVQQAALTKGTQGATGVTTQDLKDSGRVAISMTTEFSPIAVTEAMLSMSVSKDGAAPSVVTSYAVTAGKRLRITSISSYVENTLGTSIQRAYLRLRFAATGGALITSPLQISVPMSASGTVKSMGAAFEDVPDGFEYLGDGTKALGFSLQAPDWVTAAATLKVYVTVIAFEY